MRLINLTKGPCTNLLDAKEYSQVLFSLWYTGRRYEACYSPAWPDCDSVEEVGCQLGVGSFERTAAKNQIFGKKIIAILNNESETCCTEGTRNKHEGMNTVLTQLD